jgi:glycosyltransferase involved in cell wall biosynthesis
MRTVGRMMVKAPDLPLKVILVGFNNEAERLDFLGRHGDPAHKALDDRRAFAVVNDLAPCYAGSDAFVMNSQGLGENFGRVTIEAMAFGLPVLGTDAGGTPEIVEHGVTGLLHPVGDAGQDRLAENILTLLRNPLKAQAMGEAGIGRVQESFASARFLSELGSLLRSCPQHVAESLAFPGQQR